jgi:hypothetical protein
MADITGYRELGPGEVVAINRLKGVEAQLVEELGLLDADGDGAAARWVALARHYLEIGMMFAVKAVARPGGGLGRGPG